MNVKYDKILDCLREEDTPTAGSFVGIKNHLKLGDDLVVSDCFQYLSYKRMSIDSGVTVTIDDGAEFGVHNGILKNDGLIINNGILIID